MLLPLMPDGAGKWVRTLPSSGPGAIESKRHSAFVVLTILQLPWCRGIWGLRSTSRSSRDLIVAADRSYAIE